MALVNKFAFASNITLFIEGGLDENGGYVNHPDDPGGETKYGISKRAYPHLDIKNLSKVDALELYRQDYWDKCSCEDYPLSLGLLIFDFAINSGVNRSCRYFQRTLNNLYLSKLKEDGILGNMTKKAYVKNTTIKKDGAYFPNYKEEVHKILKEFQAQRLNFVMDIDNESMELGWSRRLISVFYESVQL